MECPWIRPTSIDLVMIMMYLSMTVSIIWHQTNVDVPRANLIIPMIPALLVTRFPLRMGLVTNLISPEGLSTTRAGEFGEEGETKVY